MGQEILSHRGTVKGRAMGSPSFWPRKPPPDMPLRLLGAEPRGAEAVLSPVIDGPVREEINSQAFAGGELGGVSILKILNECATAHRVAADTSLQPALPTLFLARVQAQFNSFLLILFMFPRPCHCLYCPVQREPHSHSKYLHLLFLFRSPSLTHPGRGNVKSPALGQLWRQKLLFGQKRCSLGSSEPVKVHVGFSSAL